MELFSFSKTGIEDLDLFLEAMIKPTKFLGCKHYGCPLSQILTEKGKDFKKREWFYEYTTSPTDTIPDRIDDALAQTLLVKLLHIRYTYRNEENIRISAIEVVGGPDVPVYFFGKSVSQGEYLLLRMLLGIHRLAVDPNEGIENLYDAFKAYYTQQWVRLADKNGLGHIINGILRKNMEG
ncbi:MAG: hypothetical protein KO464_02350 [Candidatus Methanofastidiosum sp.]|nr:hypothetical protein [Methanofastidiosum sp.]